MLNYLKSSSTGNFFLLAGPCVIEGEEMALDIAETIANITARLNIPYVFKGSYRKANRSRIDSFTGIGDEKALKILRKVRETFNIPVVTDITHRKKRRSLPNMSTYSRFRLFCADRPNCLSRLQRPAKW